MIFDDLFDMWNEYAREKARIQAGYIWKCKRTGEYITTSEAMNCAEHTADKLIPSCRGCQWYRGK